MNLVTFRTVVLIALAGLASPGCGVPLPESVLLPVPEVSAFPAENAPAPAAPYTIPAAPENSDQDVAVPSPTEVEENPVREVLIGTGPASLSSSVWAIYDVSGLAPAFLGRVKFDAAGAVNCFFDNVFFAPETIGDVLILDEASHAAPFSGGSYRGASYGLEEGSTISFAGVGQFYVGPLQVATGEMFVYGVRQGPERFHGSLEVSVHTIQELPGISTTSNIWSVIALREDAAPKTHTICDKWRR